MAGIMITGKGIPLASLLALKHSIRLEIKTGLRRRGQSALMIAKTRFGLPKRTPSDKVLERVEKAIEEAAAELNDGDIRRV